ncbi:molybdate ABC transporter permease subunit [Myxosarcina sp. GI1(2024)]
MDFDLSPLWISLKTASVATVFTFFVGIAAASRMKAYKGKGKGLIDGILTLPLVLPPTVVGFLLLLLFGINNPVGKLLNQLGITVIFSWPATVIAATVVSFPLMYKTVLSAFKQIDNDFIDCARTLGASEGKIFWSIVLPLAWPGVVAGTILAFARALGEFGATLMLAGSIHGRTQTMPIAIFFAAEAGNMGRALIWVLITIFISLGVIAAINYWDESQELSKNRNIESGNLITKLFNFVILGQFKDLDLADKATSSQENNLLSSYQVNSKKPELSLDIEKNFQNFKLKVDFTANGNTLGLLGASGSGKSMTLRCIAGLEKPTKGFIVLNDRVLFCSHKKIDLPTRKRRIGFLFQNYALFPHMTVAQNIAFALQNLPKEERLSRIGRYIEMMELEGLENRYPHQISGGQQQRVALARALAIEPEALLLDEPLSALDTYLRNRIERLLKKVLTSYQGTTLFITHKLEEAYRVSNNLLILKDGKIIAEGSKEDIFEHPRKLAVAQITECKNFSQARAISSQKVKALDWNCTLKVVETIPDSLTHIGIRAHHIAFADELEPENTFKCWVTETSETQHRMTAYLKLNSPPKDSEDYDLQVEIFKEKWGKLKDRTFPWYVYLDPLRLILIET